MLTNITLIYNEDKHEAREVVRVLQKIFKKCRVTVKKGISCSTELVIGVGGDGTVLKTARQASSYNIPVACINVGTLGFLGLDVKPEALNNFIVTLLKENFQIEERIILEARVKGEKFLALNDIVVKNGDTARVIDLTVYFNNKNLYNITGDGVIVSTPTGSTAYSLAAGGPVVSPELELMIVNPLNPHALNSRPFISGPGKIKIIGKKREQAYILTADGQKSKKIKPEDEIDIKVSNNKLKLVKNNRDFISILTEKLSWRV